MNSATTFRLDYGLFILTPGTSDMSIFEFAIDTWQEAEYPSKQKKQSPPGKCNVTRLVFNITNALLIPAFLTGKHMCIDNGHRLIYDILRITYNNGEYSCWGGLRVVEDGWSRLEDLHTLGARI